MGKSRTCDLGGVIMNHLDPFSGIGGFAQAAKSLGIETQQFVVATTKARNDFNINYEQTQRFKTNENF